MNDLERAVVKHMLEDSAETATTCRMWLEKCGGDRERAEVELANALREDLQETSQVGHKLVLDLVHGALARICWRRVARALCGRFLPRRRPVLTPSIN